MDVLDALLRAKTAKRWGFMSAPVQNADGTYVLSDVARVDLQPHEAREWTITLTSFSYQGGPAFAPALPPRNQTVSFPLWSVKVTWGVDGATDTAFVDYPAQGCTFQVHASTLQLSIQTRQAVLVLPVAVPIVGAFISPSRRFGYGPIASPTLTNVVSMAATPSSQLMAIPPRAVAYRVYNTGSGFAVASENATSVFQLGASDVQFQSQIDGIYQASTGGLGNDIPVFNSPAYRKINTRSQLLNLVSNSNIVPYEIAVEFLLDLG